MSSEEESRPRAALYVEQDMLGAVRHELGSAAAMVYSARCPGKETANEDAAALIPFEAESGVLAVADGLGGGPAGHQAARLAVETLKAAIEEGAPDKILLRTAILDGIEAANRAVLELGLGAATTLALVAVDGTSVRPYHVGDSMILVVGQRGKVKLQTTSHSPVGLAVEAGFLDQRAAMYHEDRHLVSNVIGSEAMKIEIGPTIRLAPRDTLLLASDGLIDNLHLEEIVERIRKGPLEEVAGRLAADTRQRMTQPESDQPSKHDDLTFVVFRCR